MVDGGLRSPGCAAQMIGGSVFLNSQNNSLSRRFLGLGGGVGKHPAAFDMAEMACLGGPSQQVSFFDAGTASVPFQLRFSFSIVTFLNGIALHPSCVLRDSQIKYPLTPAKTCQGRG